MARGTATRAAGSYMPTKYQFPRITEETAGPWLGVKDGPSANQGDAQHCQFWQNYYLVDPGEGAVTPRPSFALLLGGTTLGTPGATYPQGFATYAPVGKSPQNFVFLSGRIIQFTLSGASADVTPANVVLSATAPHIYAVNYANLLIITDGVNPPYAWGGPGTGNANVIQFDNSITPVSSVAYGPPTVYYDQLFFVMNASRSTLMWSEPNSPLTGYILTISGFTFADTWTLAQTGQADIQCILGTNEALYYWRSSSIGALYGSPAINFATTATHDSISLVTGTTTPRCVVLTDREIYFLDQSGRPFLIQSGGYLAPMWQDCVTTFVSRITGIMAVPANPSSYTFSGTLPIAAAHCSGVYDPNTKCIYWTLPQAGNPISGPLNTAVPTIFVFDTRTRKYYGQWCHTSLVSPAIGMFQLANVPDDSGASSYPSANIAHLDLSGRIYVLNTGSGFTFGVGAGDSTVFAPGTPSPSINSYVVETLLEASEMIYDPWVETLVDRVQFVTLPFTFCNVLIDYSTSRLPLGGHSLAQNFAQPLAVNSLRSEIGVGVNTTARAFRPRIRNTPQASLAQGPRINITAIAIAQCKVRGYRVDMNPSSP